MTTVSRDPIAELAGQLIASANSHDWSALARYNLQVEKLLKALRPVPNDYRSAVAQLQAAHQQAQTIVEREKDKVLERMASLRDNREGLKAYEQSGGPA